MNFAADCWAIAEAGVDEDDRLPVEGPLLNAEVYMACDLTRLSFTYRDGGALKPTPEFLAALSALEREAGLTREVRTEPDASGDFNFILNRGGTYVARVTPEKLFVEPKACPLPLGMRLLALYEKHAPGLERIVDAWIAGSDAEEGSPESERNFWAHSQVTNWVLEDRPDLLWAFILATYKRDLSDKVSGVLAAGPMEDLLAQYGPSYIDRVERLASEDPKFNELLGRVWQNDMTDEVWARIQAVRKQVW